jgi:hypothetical protein
MFAPNRLPLQESEQSQYSTVEKGASMSSTGSDLPSLDFRSWTTLVVFILINITVIRPFTVALPLLWTTPQRAWHVRFDYGTGPLLGVLILIATTSIQGTDIVNGIVGNSQLQVSHRVASCVMVD